MKLKSILAVFCFIFLINFCITPIFTVAFATESLPDDEPSTVVSEEPSEAPASQPSEPDEPSEVASEPDEPISSEPPVISDTPSEVVSSQAPVSEAPLSSTTIEYPSPSSDTSHANTSSVAPVSSSPQSEYEPDEPIYVVSIPEDTNSNVSSDVSSYDTSSWEDSSSEDEMVLPDVTISDISVPQVIGSVTDGGKSSKDNLVKGMIAWVCIGIGVVLVLTVIFGSSYSKQSAKNKRVKGRKHYKASKTKRKKRLLSDKYYYR